MASQALQTTVPPKRRLALFLDGTWNEQSNNTNVWRMRGLCAKQGTDGLEQVAYYSTGVGTFPGIRIIGGAIGYGLNSIIVQAYEWLVQNYNQGDELFIFGFSRGAYTARSLAGFVAMCGILKPGSPISVDELYSRYRQGTEVRTIQKLQNLQRSGALGHASLLERWMLHYAVTADITMVGVWDTVGALGAPVFNIPGISSSTYGFLHTGLRLSVKHAYHALAIDEHRLKFTPTLWTKNTHLDQPIADQAKDRPLDSVEQRWFVGSHANVGGGYSSDLLAQTPLRWMMTKASGLGLTFRETVDSDVESVTASITDSFREFMHGAYFLAQRGLAYYRTIGSEDVRNGNTVTSVINETIDGSVFERWRRDRAYRPPNLVEWARTKDVDPGSIDHAVLAKRPRANLT